MTINGGTAVGTTAKQHIREMELHSHAFRETRARLALAEELARR